MSNLSKHIEQYFSIPYQEKAQREALIIKIMQTYGTPLNIIDAAGNPHYNLPMPMQDAPPNDRVQYYLFGLSQGADIPKEHLDSVIQGIQSILIGLLNKNAQMNYLINLMLHIQDYYADKDATTNYNPSVSSLLLFINSLTAQLASGKVFSAQYFPKLQSEQEEISRLQQENEQLHMKAHDNSNNPESKTKIPKINLDVDEVTAGFIFKLLRLYSQSAINHDNLNQTFQIRGQDITEHQAKNWQAKSLSKVKKEVLEKALGKDFGVLHQDFLQAIIKSNQKIFTDLQKTFKDVQQGFYDE